MIQTERVLSGSRSYPVDIGPGALDGVPSRLAEAEAAPDLVLVTDGNVGPLYADDVGAALSAAGFRVLAHVLPAGEAGKDRRELDRLHDALASAALGRDVTLLSLGGGVVSDLAGYAAATWMRGVTFAAMPTTLLAMVDASVGGKTAVNLPAGKNLVGAFWPPRFVVADTATLSTLPAAEFRSGLGEVAKAAILGDPTLFERLERLGPRDLETDRDLAVEIVLSCVRLKADIVARDEREAGERRLLNLGHTLGHALEAATDFAGVRHGDAVAIGIVFASRLAVRLGRLPEADADRIEALLTGLGLPTEIPGDLSRDALADHVLRDKKVRGREPRWVLPVAIGRCAIEPVPDWRGHLDSL